MLLFACLESLLLIKNWGAYIFCCYSSAVIYFNAVISKDESKFKNIVNTAGTFIKIHSTCILCVNIYAYIFFSFRFSKLWAQMS